MFAQKTANRKLESPAEDAAMRGREGHTPSRILKNSFFILLSRGIQLASSFFIVVAVARYLSITQYGEYSFLVAFVSSIMALAYFGIQQVLIREIAKDPTAASGTLGAAIQLRMLLSVLAASAILISLYFMKLPRVLVLSSLVAIASEFFLSFSMLSKSVFQAFEQMVYEPLLTLSYCLVFAAGVSTVIFFDLGFLWLFVAMALANLAQLVPASYILSRRFVRPVFGIDKTLFRKFLQDSVVIGIGIFFYQNLFKINVLMLRWLGTVADVSYFNAPHNLIMQLQVIPMSLVMAVFPLFSRMIYNDREKMIAVYEQIFRVLFIFSSFAAVLLSVFSREIIEIVFGSRYSQSVTALTIISWAMIPLTMDMLLNGILIAMNKQRYSVIYAGAALVLNGICCLFFVPKYGFIAAAVISVFSYTFLFLCSLYFIEKNDLSIRFGRPMVKTASAVCICGTAAYLLKSVSLPLAGISAVLFFFGTIFMTRAFTIEELVAVRGMIFQRRRRQS